MSRPPLPPFTPETATQKVRMAEDAWNMRDPERVSLAYSEDSEWRNRAEFLKGRAEIVAFLARKWRRERDYRLIKEIWAHDNNRIAVRFASINDLPIKESERKYRWPQGPRPADHPGLSALGL
ncbi:MAG: nuclear transport factor 2 family protein [Methylocystis sp.]|nr:nuclear transport factor 2 family protein [Methylocystis sp.]